jgi:crotonobetainyl-CoA:carnitine CoA-transferase CaiB-like acyl-CoA transferase
MVHDPQVKARNMHVEVEHPDFGPVVITNSALKLSKTPGTIDTPAPRVGQHTAEILGNWLGYDEATIAALQTQGVI